VLKSDGTKNNKIAILTGLLQGIYLLLFFTELIGKIGQINIYIAFGICAILFILYLAAASLFKVQTWH
jgi:hypothetical protein